VQKTIANNATTGITLSNLVDKVTGSGHRCFRSERLKNTVLWA